MSPAGTAKPIERESGMSGMGVRSNGPTRLNLYFPEWQGYGEDARVLEGARRIRERLEPELDFTVIPVPDTEDLTVGNGILGHAANLRQLTAARDLIAEAAPRSIFLVGGTCAGEIAPVSWLNHVRQGDLAVLWLDAHGDLNTPGSSPSGHFHGMPLRVLLGEGPDEIVAQTFSRLRPEQVFLVGARDFDPAEERYIAENDLRVLPPADLTDPEKLSDLIRAGGYTGIYIHLDLDILEPADFPHLLIPVPGGVPLAGLLELLARLRAAFTVAGASIVEYVPRDATDPDALIAILGLLAAVGEGK